MVQTWFYKCNIYDTRILDMITGLSGLAIKFDHQYGFGNAEEISIVCCK